MILLEQILNGAQFGTTLFLVASGLTLVFGIMNLVNLSHGSLYMVGAYVSAKVYLSTGSFVVSVSVAIVAALAVGVLIERVLFRFLYERDHLDQVLVTFGLIMFFNEAVKTIWGPGAIDAPVPAILQGNIEVLRNLHYPLYRLTMIFVGLATALGLYILIGRTRLGMLIRAGASDRTIVGALGANISLLNTIVFAIGAGLAALAGTLAGPIFSVEPGMGDDVLILAFVVIVVGGIGSIRGAFIGAMSIGMIDTLGRAFMLPLFVSTLGPVAAAAAAPAVASMLIYLTMAIVLLVRPQGLFPIGTRQ
jgi:branched-chain amino acid transport system permease protein